LNDQGKTVQRVDSNDALKWAGPSRSPDVTGGMTLRVTTAIELAQANCESLLVNGNREGDLEQALTNPSASFPFATRVVSTTYSS
jgi:isopentenyl phosphate kinase